jgi:uncharacterized membrane protein
MAATAPRNPASTPSRTRRTVARIALGAGLLFAGTMHLTAARSEFRAQVPEWLPLDEDFVVLASGGVELTLGAALVVLPRHRRLVGLITAAFFVAVFPGNLSQWWNHVDAFGLNTDGLRLARLFGQPLLVAWAVYAAGGLRRR